MKQYKAVFDLLQKLHLQIYARQVMTSQIIPLPFALLNLQSVEKKGKNYKNLNILRIIFRGLSFGEKIKI